MTSHNYRICSFNTRRDRSVKNSPELELLLLLLLLLFFNCICKELPLPRKGILINPTTTMFWFRRPWCLARLEGGLGRSYSVRLGSAVCRIGLRTWYFRLEDTSPVLAEDLHSDEQVT